MSQQNQSPSRLQNNRGSAKLRTEGSELLARIEALEAQVARLQQTIFPTHQPLPVMSLPAGCVCPAGAEIGCNSAGCPRRGYSWRAHT